MQFQEIKLKKLDKQDVKVLVEALEQHYNILLQHYNQHKSQLSMLQVMIIRVQKLHFNFYKQEKFSLKLMYHYAEVVQKALHNYNTQSKDQYLKNRSLKLITQLDQVITNGTL